MKKQRTAPIVDSHCHIYPDKIAARAVEGIGSFYHYPMEEDGTEATMCAEAAKAGITHSIIFSVATKPAQVRSINTFIAETVSRHPGSMTGLGALHPDSEDLEGDIRHLRELGLRGVKLHPDVQGFRVDDERCLKIFERCEEYGLPVLVHAGDARYDNSNPNRMKRIPELFPHLTLIAAHLGGYSVWDEAAKILPGYPNLYVDCSSSLFAMTPERGAELVRLYGADRVLFATDYPMWNPAGEVRKFMALGLTEEENEQILWKNAKKLFHLDTVKETVCAF